MAKPPLRPAEKGQIPVLFLFIGLLALAAVVAVFLAGPGEPETTDPGLQEPSMSSQDEGPREVIGVTEQPGQAAARTESTEPREFVASGGDGRPAGAAILGTVQNDRGERVAEAQVVLTENVVVQNPFAPVNERRGARYTATTDAEGRYRFARLPANVEFQMWVQHAQYAPRQGYPVRALPAEEQELQPIVLDSGYQIGGSVRDEAGNPLQGATVTVRMAQVLNFLETEDQLAEEADLGRLRTTTTNEDGGFAFEFLAEGIYQLEASLEDFATGVENAVTCMGDEKMQVRDLVLGTEHRLAGVVRDEEGNPVPGALVAAARTRPRPILQKETVADENGAFELRALPQGGYGISVIAEGFASARMSHVQSNRTDLEFVMRRKAGVTGRVTRPDGSPVTAYSLELFRVNQGTAQYGVTNRTINVQHPDGVYLFPDLDRGSYVLLVRADGFSPTYTGGFYVERQLVSGQDVQVQAGGILRGTVLGPDDRPLPGATVTLRGRDYNVWQQHSLFGGAVGDPNNVPKATARTNAKGEFELRDAFPGDHQLEVQHPSFLTLYVGVYVQTDRVTMAGDIIMRPGSSIEGVVNQRAGGPAAGASVYLTLKDQNAGFFNKKTIADARGRFRFDGLQPGTYEVAALRDDANAFFFPGASPGSAQDVLIQREAEKREVTLIVPDEN